MNRLIVCVLTGLMVQASLADAESRPRPPPVPRNLPDIADPGREQRAALMDHWRESRFGLFIHWGVYSHLGGYYKGQRSPMYAEHIMSRMNIPVEEYEAVAREFEPDAFDADAWVQIAKDAGMRYIVVTAKHHDGFAIYPSDFTDWDIKGFTSYPGDPLQELAEACERHGLDFGIYYSHLDWHFTSYDPGYEEFRLNQVRELAARYKPFTLWFDDFIFPGSVELVTMLRTEFPHILLNERVLRRERGRKYADYVNAEQKMPAETLREHDWEGCMTMNSTWGYRTGDESWKQTFKLVQALVDVVSKGGNFLLNVGPDGRGVIPEGSVVRLREMGEWLQVYGEAIYGNTYAMLAEPEWGRYTRNDEALYAHVFEWPADGRLPLVDLEERPAAFCVASGAELPVENGDSGWVVDLRSATQNPHASVVKLLLL